MPLLAKVKRLPLLSHNSFFFLEPPGDFWEPVGGLLEAYGDPWDAPLKKQPRYGQYHGHNPAT